MQTVDLLSSVLADKELTAYLQQMVEENINLNHYVLADVEAYFGGNDSKEQLMKSLEAEWKFQKEKTNVGKWN